MISKILPIAAWLFSSHAVARTVTPECVWNHLPQPTREDVFAKYHAAGAEGFGRAAIGDDQVIGAYRACSPHSQDEPPLELGPALVGTALRFSAAHELRSSDGLNTDVLDSAWHKLTGAERQLLISAFRHPEADIPREAFDALDKAVRLAGLRMGSRSPRYRSYADYFMGRAEEQAYSAPAVSPK